MLIKQLRLNSFRNFAELEIEPSASLNLIRGSNGAGKSSLLESIYVMGYGRSFRTSRANSLIQFDKQEASVFCKLGHDKSVEEYKIGCSRHRKDGFSYRINGQSASSLAELVKHLPVQLFTPQSSDVILGSPLLRRKFLDWALFHVELSFVSLSSQYTKLLAHRNALLRKMAKSALRMPSDEGNELSYWTLELASRGEIISQIRQDYLSLLSDKASVLIRQFLPEFQLELRYNKGWDASLSLLEALTAKQQRELMLGYTDAGPHKADVRIIVNEELAADTLSRGQLRVLMSSLQIAQIQLLKEKAAIQTIYMIDDISAELDDTMKARFLALAAEANSQIFVTAIEKQQLTFTNDYNDKKMFHVEHNQVNEE